MQLTRTTVHQNFPRTGWTLNINDDNGFDPHCSYTLREHIKDLAAEGITLVSQSGSEYKFSDGSTRNLTQHRERIDMTELNPETVALLMKRPLRPDTSVLVHGQHGGAPAQ